MHKFIRKKSVYTTVILVKRLTTGSQYDIIEVNEMHYKGESVMTGFKVILRYTVFWIEFAITVAVMLALLTAAVIGIPAGTMMAVFGIAVLMFKADFVITELAPQVMLFGGLSAGFFAAALGLIAVKLGFFISRHFVRVRRRCDKLRGWYA